MAWQWLKLFEASQRKSTVCLVMEAHIHGFEAIRSFPTYINRFRRQMYDLLPSSLALNPAYPVSVEGLARGVTGFQHLCRLSCFLFSNVTEDTGESRTNTSLHPQSQLIEAFFPSKEDSFS